MFLDYRSVCSLHTYIFCVAGSMVSFASRPNNIHGLSFSLLAARSPLTMWLLLLLQTPKEYFIYISMNLFVVLFSSSPYFAPILSLFIRVTLKLPSSASSCIGGATFNLERWKWKWKNSNRRWFMSLVFLSFQRFDTNEEMVAHQAKHLTESKYKCELCGKHFPSQSSVWKHTKAHSGERPFVW